MIKQKSHIIWLVNVVAFLLLAVLSLTGLINWLILPKGYEAKGSILISMRHLFREIHEWTAVLFIVVIFIHLVLHWPYVKLNLKKYKIVK